jgi:hypothetical protein
MSAVTPDLYPGLLSLTLLLKGSVAVLTFCAQHPSSRWLSNLLGAAPERAEVKTTR